MPTKSDDSSVECYSTSWFLIAARPRGVKNITVTGCVGPRRAWESAMSTRTRLEKCQQTMQIGSPSETQELRCGTESRSIPAQSKANNLLSFTEWRSSMQSHSIDLPQATDLHTVCELLHPCISDSACFKSYKAIRAVHVWVSSTSGCSGVAQGLLLLYRHDHVDGNFIIGRNTEHDDSKKLSVMHGYVEDMELSESLEITNAVHYTQVTGDHYNAVHVTSLPGSLYVCFALCNCSRTHTDVLTWCYIVGYSTYYNSAPGMCS